MVPIDGLRHPIYTGLAADVRRDGLAVGEWRGVLAVAHRRRLFLAQAQARRGAMRGSSGTPTPVTPSACRALIPSCYEGAVSSRPVLAPRRRHRDAGQQEAHAPALTPKVLSMVSSSTRNNAPPQSLGRLAFPPETEVPPMATAIEARYSIFVPNVDICAAVTGPLRGPRGSRTTRKRRSVPRSAASRAPRGTQLPNRLERPPPNRAMQRDARAKREQRRQDRQQRHAQQYNRGSRRIPEEA